MRKFNFNNTLSVIMCIICNTNSLKLDRHFKLHCTNVDYPNSSSTVFPECFEHSLLPAAEQHIERFLKAVSKNCFSRTPKAFAVGCASWLGICCRTE